MKFVILAAPLLLLLAGAGPAAATHPNCSDSALLTQGDYPRCSISFSGSGTWSVTITVEATAGVVAGESSIPGLECQAPQHPYLPTYCTKTVTYTKTSGGTHVHYCSSRLIGYEHGGGDSIPDTFSAAAFARITCRAS